MHILPWRARRRRSQSLHRKRASRHASPAERIRPLPPSSKQSHPVAGNGTLSRQGRADPSRRDLPFLPRTYQEDFVKRCLDALNGVDSSFLEEAKNVAESAKVRKVGINVEDRPDLSRVGHV